MKRIRLTFVSPTFYPAFYFGGPIFSTYYNALGLAELGFEVYVSTTDSNGPAKLDVRTNDFNLLTPNFFVKYYSPSSKRGFSYRMVVGLWSDISSADIVYTQSVFSVSSIFTLLYSSLLSKPVLFSPRGQLGEWCLKAGSRFKKLWLKLFIKPFAYKITWHVTAVQEKQELLAIYPNAVVHVIPNGIDLNQFDNIPVKKDKTFYNKYSDGKTFSNVIVSMGRVHAKKGFDILLEALSKVLNLYPDTGLFIAGEDYGEEKNLEEMILNKGLSNKVFLVGQINDMTEKVNFLSNADLFALASHNENFGIVYAEALAAGTPIVASKNTPWEIVETFNCGKWVNNTSEDFKEAIVDILKSDSDQLGKNGIKLIEERFGWPSIAKQFKNIFYSMRGNKYE